MKIALGADHAGWEIKNSLLKILKDRGYEVKDFGCHNNSACDYPDFGLPVAEAVSRGEFEGGILICGAGVGMSLVANKVPRIRAALCLNSFMTRVSREHNDANILILPGRILSPKESEELASIFLETKFSGEERHVRRLAKIEEIERKYMKEGKAR